MSPSRHRANVAFAYLAALVACDRAHPKDAAPAPPPPPPKLIDAAPAAAVPAATAGACKLDDVPARFPAPPGRLVAIGDIHGDLAAARSALKAAGAIDDHDAWIGGNLWIVQTGDVLDRGDDEQAIIELFGALETAAAKAGGRVIVLNGNHELMNAQADFRYVTPGGFADWKDAPGIDTSAFAKVPEQARARVAALLPGGAYAKREARHNAIAIVGDWVFSHAGVLGDWVTHVDDTNRAERCFLDGQAHGEAPAAATADDGPLWTRALGGDTVDCAPLATAIAALKVKGEVVGHTVQRAMNAACDGTLWRIDVGLAKIYQGPIEVLEVYPTPKVLKGTR